MPQFSAAYRALYSLGRSDGAQDELTPIEDKLLFIWLAHKTQTVCPPLETQFGLSSSRVRYWIDQLLPVLQLASRNLSTTKLPSGCKRFLQLLNTYQVEYLVIGGQAVAFHGYLRPILDLDVFVSTDRSNAEKIEQLLHSFGHGVIPHVARYFEQKEKVIRIGQPPLGVERSESVGRFVELGKPPVQLEVMTSISAVTFEECYKQRVAGMIDEVPVQVIGLAHLKANKEASIGEKHANDVANLNKK